MSRLVEQIQRLSGNDLTVLITGESGTGKELVPGDSRRIASQRRDVPALQLHDDRPRPGGRPAVRPSARRSFTGAVSDQPGLVRSAAGGTLFLDEIGDLPIDVSRSSCASSSSEIMPIGDSPQRVDVRVLAATNADLEQRVAEGKFREDLYYRLSVIRIHVPPARPARRNPHLSTYSPREASRTPRKPDIQLSSEALDMFLAVLVAG